VKRILILTAGYGEGHNSAARGIESGLARLAPTAHVESHDLFAETFGRPNEWVRKGYLTLINKWPRSWGWVYRWLDRKQDFDRDLAWFRPLKHHFADLLQRFQPDIVVSVFPPYPYLLRQIQPKATCKSIVVVTDSITVNAIWYRSAADAFLVPNEQSAVVVRAGGVAADKIHTFGFPVNPKFADLPRRPPPSSERRPRLLYMINAGTRQAPEIARRLTQLDIDLTVTVGRDEKLRAAIEQVAASKAKVVGWTDQLPELLCQSHLLIGKAGGATVQETIAAGCPMIINHIVSGQEEGNAQLIVETKSGAIAHAPAEIANQVQHVFSDDARLWREWAGNIGALSRPAASLEIADFLMGL
jgi:UDP-N-acetylglucosamine:LPS N-acetylglucosamine transferase